MKLYYLIENTNIEQAVEIGKTVFPKSVLDRVMKKNGKSRERSALAYLLLRYCLKKEGKGELFNQIKFTKLGKPYVDGVEFSLTHTKGMLACAVSNNPVGVDIERIRKVPESAVKKFIDDDKYNLFINSVDKDYLSIREWVIKEAWLKEMGTGVSKRLKSVVPSLISDNVWKIEGHKIAIFREGEFVLGISSKSGIPTKATNVKMVDVI